MKCQTAPRISACCCGTMTHLCYWRRTSDDLLVKALEYQFEDGPVLDVVEGRSCAILGHTVQMAYHGRSLTVESSKIEVMGESERVMEPWVLDPNLAFDWHGHIENHVRVGLPEAWAMVSAAKSGWVSPLGIL